MATYAWATPRKADEYYLQSAGRTPADLWHAVADGHIRVSIMDVEFSGDQIRALLKLIHHNVSDDEKLYELPIWMAVNVDDVERTLCGSNVPPNRKGRPSKSGADLNRDYQLAVEVSKLLRIGAAQSVADAARTLIEQGLVKGASSEAKVKKVQRAYATHFRHD